jgi:NAD(P)-dependent dehydrogenase (short-subunit alcohol dehydrogenase family)
VNNSAWTIAVVTGANRGLGYAVARQLVARGVHVVLTARDCRAGRAAADLLTAEGGAVVFHQLDVEDRASIKTLAEFLEENYDRVDILINNAGSHPKSDKGAMSVPAEAMMRAFNVNCLGALQVSQQLSALLRKSSAGRIVNVSTILASPAYMDQFPGAFFAYRISKSALNAVTAAMAVELRDLGISVNAVHPGWLKTRMGGPDAPQTAEEGADAVVHLALQVPATVTGRLFAQKQECPW